MTISRRSFLPIFAAASLSPLVSKLATFSPSASPSVREPAVFDIEVCSPTWQDQIAVMFEDGNVVTLSYDDSPRMEEIIVHGAFEA